MTTIIHEDDDIQVLHQPGVSGFSLVTFGGLTDRPATGPEGPVFWGQAPAAKLGLDTVGILAKAENWYPAAAMQRAVPAIRAVLRAEAVGYGFSMGGYAALKYGALLGLRQALAVSPQGSIDPADMPADARHHRRFLPSRHAGMAVAPEDLARFTVQIVDPYEAEDRAQAEFIAARAPVVTVPLPFLSHATIWHLAESDMLDRVLQRMRAGDAAGLRQLLRAHRASSAHWARLLGRAAFIRGRDARAERLWHRARELGLSPAWMSMERASALEARGWRRGAAGMDEAGEARTRGLDAAEADLLAAARLYQADATAQLRLAARLVEQGRTGSAIPLLRRAAALRPQDAATQQALLRALRDDGQHLAALEAGLEAVRHGGGEPGLLDAVLSALPGVPPEAAEAGLWQLLGAEPGGPAHGMAALLLGRALRARGQPAEALRLADIAAAELPQSDQPLILKWQLQEAVAETAPADVPVAPATPAPVTQPPAPAQPGWLGWLGGRFGRRASPAGR